MKVLLDGFYLGKPYGYGRYVGELIRGLALHQSDEVDLTVAIRKGAEITIPEEFPGVSWHAMPAHNLVLWEQLMVPRLARKLDVDIVHYPANSRAAIVPGIPVVLSVHDLIFMENASVSELRSLEARQLVERYYLRHTLRRYAGRSAGVISVSGTTRSALTNFGVSSVVGYNTVDGLFAHPSAAVPAPERDVRPYLLHRGGVSPHRNTARVISVFTRVREHFPDLDLRIIGVPEGRDVFDLGDSPGVIFESWRTDDDIADLYRGAAVVLATSLKEGFGLPIIEGFAAHVPVVTSEREPMREIGGAAALLVDPENDSDLEQAVCRVLADPDLAASLVRAGRQRYEAFRSDKVSSTAVQVYRDALRGRTF